MDRKTHAKRKIVFSMAVSADGYVVDANGSFSWATPDEEVHQFFNDLENETDTHLYGRRMYELMAQYWPFVSDDSDEAPVVKEFARYWRDAEKIVFSTTLQGVTTDRTTLVDHLDADFVRQLKNTPGKNMSIGGPGIAESFMRLGLLDEVQMLVFPVSVGGGTPMLPKDVHQKLRLVNTRRFASGVVMLHYEIVPEGSN